MNDFNPDEREKLSLGKDIHQRMASGNNLDRLVERILLRVERQVFPEIARVLSDEIELKCRDFVIEQADRYSGIHIPDPQEVLFLFETSLGAVHFALACQRALVEWETEKTGPHSFRVAIHQTAIQVDQNYGIDETIDPKDLSIPIDQKAVLDQLFSLAQNQQILLSRTAFNLARAGMMGSEETLKNTLWMEHGRYKIVGLPAPLEVCEVGFSGISYLSPPPESDQVTRAMTSHRVATLGWRPAVGATIPGRTNWTLHHKLGESANGEAWLAQQKSTHLLHAFKFIFDPSRLNYLKKEIALLQIIRDNLGERSDIARIYDVQTDQAPYYLEVDYSTDGTLEHWWEEKGGPEKIPLGQRLEIVAQVSEALEAAHSLGIVHKAVQPSNILIEEKKDQTTQARLTDFGEGKLVDSTLLEEIGSTDLSFGPDELLQLQEQEGVSTNTVYSAPEVMTGGMHSPQSDIFSLGVLLYQMVIGKIEVPFKEDWDQSDTDPTLAKLIQGATSSDPEQRIQTSSELVEALRGFTARETPTETVDGERPLHRNLEGRLDEQTIAVDAGTSQDEYKIGDYTVLRKIGEGGFGAVYLAKNPLTPDRHFAIKIFTPSEKDSLTSTLSDELQHVLDLVHEYIVQVRGFGVAKGKSIDESYLVMDYIEGPNDTSYNLKNYIVEKGGRLEEKEVKRIFLQILSALCSVHKKRIAHLDIKPQNILLDTQYNAYVSDFGISQAVHTASVPGSTIAMVKGATPAYAAFEQIAYGQGSRRSDIFSLGVLLLECLTGRRPETIPSSTNPRVEYAPPSSFGCNPGWDEILQHCIVYDPDERFETACEMLEEVQNLDLSHSKPLPASAGGKVAATPHEGSLTVGTILSPVTRTLARTTSSALGKVIAGVAILCGLAFAMSFYNPFSRDGENPGTVPSVPPTMTATPVPQVAPTKESQALIVPASPTATVTPSITQMPTATFTDIPPTETRTNMPPPTNTATNTIPPTKTPTPVPPTDTPTDTPMPTEKPTDTATDTPMPTNTPTHTATNTPMPTDTPTHTATSTPMPTKPPTPKPTATLKAPVFDQSQTDDLFIEIKRAIQNKDKELFDRFVESPFGRQTFWGLAKRNTLVSFNTVFDAKQTQGKQIEVTIEGDIDRSKKKLVYRLAVDWRDGDWVVTQWADRSAPVFDEAEMDRLLLKILQAFQRKDKKLFDTYNKSREGQTWWTILNRDNRIPKSFNSTSLSENKFRMEMIIEDDEGDKKRNFDLSVERNGEIWVITEWQYKP